MDRLAAVVGCVVRTALAIRVVPATAPKFSRPEFCVAALQVRPHYLLIDAVMPRQSARPRAAQTAAAASPSPADSSRHASWLPIAIPVGVALLLRGVLQQPYLGCLVRGGHPSICHAALEASPLRYGNMSTHRVRANRPFLRDGESRAAATAVVSVFDGVRLESVDLAAALTNATFGRDAYAPFSYPGPTASELPPELIGAFLKGLGPILRMHYPTQAYALHPANVHAMATVMCDPPDSDPPRPGDKNIPHVDAVFDSLAVVWYVRAPKVKQPRIDTAIFEHVPSGVTLVNDEGKRQEYSRWAKRHRQDDAQMKESNGYLSRSYTEFRSLHTIEFVEGRLAVYPGNLLHSPVLAEDDDEGLQQGGATNLACKPSEGRLTISMFVSSSNKPWWRGGSGWVPLEDDKLELSDFAPAKGGAG